MSTTSKKAWWRWPRLDSVMDGALLFLGFASVAVSGSLPLTYMFPAFIASVVLLFVVFMLEHVRRVYCERADLREADAKERNAKLWRTMMMVRHKILSEERQRRVVPQGAAPYECAEAEEAAFFEEHAVREKEKDHE